MARVIVVGAGVVGLTAAVRLLESGHRVDVLARDLPLETTSSVAAALWYPYLAFPEDRVAAWSRVAFADFLALAEQTDTGVVRRTGTEVFGAPEPDPSWNDPVYGLTRETTLPEGYVDGWTFTTPVIEMPIFLRWLSDRVEALGGTVTRMNLSALPDPASAGGSADLVVNCTALGARHLASDPSVVPVRGQVVLVEQVGVDRWLVDPDPPTYIVPRSHDIVVGGTDEHGEWSRTPSPETARAILERARRLMPELSDARVLRHKVGLRPLRPEIRLERIGDVIHCYGHGGAGVTLSWGTAAEVTALATA